MKASLTVQLYWTDGNSAQECDALRVLPGTQWSRDLGPLSGPFRSRKLSGLSQWACWLCLLATTQRLAIREGEFWALGTRLASSKSGSNCFSLKSCPFKVQPKPHLFREAFSDYCSPKRILPPPCTSKMTFCAEQHTWATKGPSLAWSFLTQWPHSPQVTNLGRDWGSREYSTLLGWLQWQTTLKLHCTWLPRVPEDLTSPWYGKYTTALWRLWDTLWPPHNLHNCGNGPQEQMP